MLNQSRDGLAFELLSGAGQYLIDLMMFFIGITYACQILRPRLVSASA